MAKKKINNEKLARGILESITAHIKDPVERQKAIDKIKADGDKERKRQEKLCTSTKPKEQLIVAVECTVESIVSSMYNNKFTPESEIVYGGRSPSYSTGNMLHSEIKVNSTKTQIKTLEFPGWPNVERGDRIRAYVFKGKEEYLKQTDKMRAELYDFMQRIGERRPKPVFVERDFQEKETPLKIEKLVDGVVVATYIGQNS